MDFHWSGTSVQKDYLFSVELFIDENIEVIFLLFDIDGDIDAFPADGDRYRLCVVLVLEEECEVLEDRAQLVWNKGKLNLRRGVPLYLCDPFELNLGEELLEGISSEYRRGWLLCQSHVFKLLVLVLLLSFFH